MKFPVGKIYKHLKKIVSPKCRVSPSSAVYSAAILEQLTKIVIG